MNIVWFREDLRLSDNPALHYASTKGPLLPIFIAETDDRKGEASKCWLYHSLQSLDKSLKGKLNIYVGDAREVISELCKVHKVQGIYWNRRYNLEGISKDNKIRSLMQSRDIPCQDFNGSLLWEPGEILKPDKTPYKVFTPYYRTAYSKTTQPRSPFSKPQRLELADKLSTISLEDLRLLPARDWGRNMMAHWEVGEEAAQKKLAEFIDDRLKGYKENRDYPSRNATSRLSPHLHFGEISPYQIWHQAQAKSLSPEYISALEAFLKELGWREFSYYLLYHFPYLPDRNFQSNFDNFPWEYNNDFFRAWTKGKTGYPMVDAGMRELWQTGYMHNRVRMIVGSFLVKNLIIDWRKGAEWFWNCLVDADEANNSASWQWVAGSGADAAPYFRIFNPVMQGQKFDPEGNYIKHFVPELKNLPPKYLFAPWNAPSSILKASGIILGQDYPLPIIDLDLSRRRALSAYKQYIKQPLCLPKHMNEEF